MGAVYDIVTIASGLSLASWFYLVFLRGGFWKTDQRLELADGPDVLGREWPSICAIVPARDEADLLPRSLGSLLAQDYPGEFHVYLVDDLSEDRTSEVAGQIAEESGSKDRLEVIKSEQLPDGWIGKVWAMQQGFLKCQERQPDYILLTDADIEHAPNSFRSLVNQAIVEQADLVSAMVHLRSDEPWGRLLIPAFVYFFMKLYPFRWVNNPRRHTAAAAGGCILVKRDLLQKVGSFELIAGEIIDDCALAQLIKHLPNKSAFHRAENLPASSPGTFAPAGGQAAGAMQLAGTGRDDTFRRVRLCLCRDLKSLRGYGGLRGIWNMVARTAFVQLRHSVVLLVGTVAAMLVVYMGPVVGVVAALMSDGDGATWSGILGGTAWALMALTYTQILKWYRVPRVYAVLLPLTALLYTAMTIDSALRTWRGIGGTWKRRTYL